MAKITCEDWDILAAKLKGIERSAEGTIKKAVQAAQKIYVDYVRDEALNQGVVDTGETRRATAGGKVEFVGGGAIGEVWPQGKRVDESHKKGERNETIAFVTEHGRYSRAPIRRYGHKKLEQRKGVPPRPFMANALERGEEDAFNAVTAVFEEAWEEEGL